jgi:hypothetical protein
MKRNILILALTSILLVTITGCALSKSDYIERIAPKIDQYHVFDEGILKVYHNLLASYTVQYPDQTYGDLLLGTIALIMQGKKVNPSQVWNPADYQIFKGTVQMMYDEGHRFAEELKRIKPPDEIKEAHYALYNCVLYAANVGANVLITLNEGTFQQLNYATDPCLKIESTLDTINSYVQSQ